MCSLQTMQNVLVRRDGKPRFLKGQNEMNFKKRRNVFGIKQTVSACVWQTVPSLRYNVMDINTYTHKYTLSTHPGPLYPKGGCYGAAIVQRLAWVKGTKKKT